MSLLPYLPKEWFILLADFRTKLCLECPEFKEVQLESYVFGNPVEWYDTCVPQRLHPDMAEDVFNRMVKDGAAQMRVGEGWQGAFTSYRTAQQDLLKVHSDKLNKNVACTVQVRKLDTMSATVAVPVEEGHDISLISARASYCLRTGLTDMYKNPT